MIILLLKLKQYRIKVNFICVYSFNICKWYILRTVAITDQSVIFLSYDAYKCFPNLFCVSICDKNILKVL